MTSITGLTAARMLAIEGASIVDGEVVGDDLILTKHDATTINAGNVRGGDGIGAAEVTQEGWHNVGAGGEPAFTNGWANRGGGYCVTRFMKDPAGIVRIEGTLITGTTGTAAFTLPVGYRPAVDQYFPVLLAAGVAGGYCSISTAGVVVLARGAASDIYLQLSFSTGQTTFPAGKSIIPVVTALPGGPTDGDEIYLQTAAMATAKTMWRLRYRAAITKWEFIGGAPMRSETGGGTTSTSATPAVWTGGPTITVPVTGEYEVDFGFSGMVDSSTTYAAIARATLYRDTTSLAINCGAATPVGQPNDGALYANSFVRATNLVLTSGWALKLYVSLQRPGGAAGTARFAAPAFMTLRPMFLG